MCVLEREVGLSTPPRACHCCFAKNAKLAKPPRFNFSRPICRLDLHIDCSRTATSAAPEQPRANCQGNGPAGAIQLDEWKDRGWSPRHVIFSTSMRNMPALDLEKNTIVKQRHFRVLDSESLLSPTKSLGLGCISRTAKQQCTRARQLPTFFSAPRVIKHHAIPNPVCVVPCCGCRISRLARS